MLLAFLLGLVFVAATITIIAIVLLTIKWVKNYISDRMKSHDAHKVVFAETREVVDEYLKNKSSQEEEISMDDLENLCDRVPFVSADIDEEGNISDFEGIKPKEVDEQLKYRMKQQKGMIIVKG